jgi:hypothetical protein
MQAFPSNHNPRTGRQEEGMTLRDYIAVHALTVLIPLSQSPDDIPHLCKGAYNWADKFMEARNG